MGRGRGGERGGNRERERETERVPNGALCAVPAPGRRQKTAAAVFPESGLWSMVWQLRLLSLRPRKRHRGGTRRVDRRTRHRPGAQRGGHGASTRIAAGRLGWRGRPATILAAVPTPSATQGRWLGLCLKLERGPGRRLALSPAGPPGWHHDRPRVSAPRWQLPASQVRPLRHTQGRRWSQVESPAGWPALEQMPGR